MGSYIEIDGDYFEIDEDEDSDIEDEYDHTIIAYTDGCCIGNHQQGDRIAGSAVFFSDGNSFNLKRPLCENWGTPTNQKAEIQGALDAVRQASEAGFHNLTIRTDSKFLINSMTNWVFKWMNNGWIKADGYPVVNAQEFQELLSESEDMDVEYEYVPGHSGIYGNEQADEMAQEAAEEY